jgi:hypothetical protein
MPPLQQGVGVFKDRGYAELIIKNLLVIQNRFLIVNLTYAPVRNGMLRVLVINLVVVLPFIIYTCVFVSSYVVSSSD